MLTAALRYEGRKERSELDEKIKLSDLSMIYEHAAFIRASHTMPIAKGSS
jgi:hypothetical protein